MMKDLLIVTERMYKSSKVPSVQRNRSYIDITPEFDGDNNISKIIPLLSEIDLRFLCKKYKLLDGSVSLMRQQASTLILRDLPDIMILAIGKQFKWNESNVSILRERIESLL